MKVTVSLSVSGPVSLLSAVAVLLKLPASRFACVTTWLAVQVMLPLGASVAGWAGVQTPTVACGSLTVTLVSVTFPVFATTRLYADRVAHHIRTRARLRLGHIQHRILREGHRLAVRVRTRLIAVRRRRVAEAARIQVRLRHHMARRAGHAPTRGEVAGWTGVQTPTVACGSLTVTLVSVTFPVFATTRLYVIVSAHHIRPRARLRLGHIQHRDSA